MTHANIVPEQKEGGKKDFDTRFMADDLASATEYFNIARQRLLDINHWHQYTGILSATFQLTNAEGKALSTEALKGLYVKIDIPGPGSITGNGNDWVRVEDVVYTADEDAEQISIRLRPSTSPENEDEQVAHFFTEHATTTIMVRRQGREITVHYSGRNEVPNTAIDSTIDKIRNAIVAGSAWLAFSDLQWKNLIEGIIKFDK